LTPIDNKDLERIGVRIVGSNPYPAQIVFCRKAVKDLADLKGRKVRTFGPTLNDLMSAIGATPVSLAYAETYTALERGVVDCAITGSGSGNAAKWYEVTATEAAKARLKRVRAENVLPAWVKRCGSRCGDIYNDVVAPISGVKYTPR